MRIGYIGNFGDWHTEIGVADALEKRATVDRYCVDTLSTGKFLNRRYDILLTSHPVSMRTDFLRKFQGIKIAHYFDLIYGWQGRDKLYFPKLKEFNLTLSTDGFSSDIYKSAGIKRHYFRQAFNPEWYYPVESKKIYDVAFIGHSYGDRKGLINELSKRYRFHHAGADNLCRGEAHSKVCASSKIMVCQNATNDIPGYWSNRVYLHLACKSFVLHPFVKGMDRFFEDGESLVYWKGKDDLFDKIDYYLDRPDERNRIAETGYALVKSRDTWDFRMEEFWEILKSDLRHTPTSLLA